MKLKIKVESDGEESVRLILKGDEEIISLLKEFTVTTETKTMNWETVNIERYLVKRTLAQFLSPTKMLLFSKSFVDNGKIMITLTTISGYMMSNIISQFRTLFRDDIPEARKLMREKEIIVESDNND